MTSVGFGQLVCPVLPVSILGRPIRVRLMHGQLGIQSRNHKVTTLWGCFLELLSLYDLSGIDFLRLSFAVFQSEVWGFDYPALLHIFGTVPALLG